jgi:hypothetical protein
MEAGVVTWEISTNFVSADPRRPSLEGTVAAITNAVYHATGKRVREGESGLMRLRVTSRSRK